MQAATAAANRTCGAALAQRNRTWPIGTCSGPDPRPAARPQDLALVDCVIEQLPPAVLPHLGQLTRLDVSDNHMWALPKDIGGLTSLQVVGEGWGGGGEACGCAAVCAQVGMCLCGWKGADGWVDG